MKSVVPVLVIKPSRGWVSLRLRELWEYRELLYFLVWRDVKVRYKQTVLGAAWAIIQPLVTMVIFSVVLGQLARLPSDGGLYYCRRIVEDPAPLGCAEGICRRRMNLCVRQRSKSQQEGE